MKINVTAEHIKKGKRGDCNLCPVALAILEEFKRRDIKPPAVDVCEEYVRIYDAFMRTHLIDFSCRVTEFIEKFDMKETVKPFAFLLPHKEKK